LPDASGDQLDSILEAEWQQHLIALAMERMKRQVSDALFQVFDLRVLRRWPAHDVAQTLGVSMGQAASLPDQCDGQLLSASGQTRSPNLRRSSSAQG
jgi:DNA-directed RNA polymerase specialized sigma24 family protein